MAPLTAMALVGACVGDDAATGPDDHGGAASPDGTSSNDTGSDGGGGVDGSLDSGPAAPACDLSKPFKTAELVAGIGAVGTIESGASLTADELTIYFDQSAEAGVTSRISFAKRSSRLDPFGPSATVASISGFQDLGPWAANDGLDLYFSSIDRPGIGGWDLWLVHRATAGASFGAPSLVANVNSATLLDYGESVTGNKTRIYWTRADFGGGNHQMFYADIQAGEPSATATHLVALESPGYINDNPRISHDDLSLFFASNRPGGKGGRDIWVATRASPNDPFGAPGNLAEVNSASEEDGAWLSLDGCRIYFDSNRTGSPRLYMASRP
jgi:hypothetical protein